MASRIDFKRIADAALARAETLVASWLPGGQRNGGEWRSLNPLRADNHEGSFSVSLVNGAWGDFATDDKGGDLVELYTYIFHGGDSPTALQRVTAARELADLLGIPDAVPERDGKGAHSPTAPRQGVAPEPAEPAPRERRSSWVPVLPVPHDAPAAPAAHEFRGIPAMSWPYHDATGQLLGYVHRFVASDGGKEVIPLTYCRNIKTQRMAWRWLQWDEPRPLYGLDRRAARPDATVLVVEGEKCADAAAEELPDLVVMSWPGGGKAASRADWSPLAGAKVITWADCDAKRKKLTREQVDGGADPHAQPLLDEADQPGVKTMRTVREILAGLDCRQWDVAIPKPGDKPDGWDVADAIAEGLTGTTLADWIRDRLIAWPLVLDAPESPPDAAEAAPAEGGKGDDEKKAKKPPRWSPGDWRWDLKCDDKGNPTGCLANVHDVMINRPEWRGLLAYDEFAQRIVKLKRPPYAGYEENNEWTGVDDSRTAIWITHEEKIAPTSATVAEAIEVLGRINPIHPVRDYLKSLPAWDGVERLDHWLCDYMMVADSEYVRKVARYYLIAMVARVMNPGCKFDYCLVLEGEQGLKKSTALSILAGEWFADTDLDLHNKDAMSALQGVWLHEFQELGALARTEATKQKSFLSRAFDKYRPVYGRRDIKAFRQLVFAGTTNEWEWNKDPTGGRRFWPVCCTDELNLDGLRAARDQLFAEALVAFQARERYWPERDEQKALFDPEQLRREAPESLVDALHEWVYLQVADFSGAQAAMDGLKLDASKLTRDLTTRIGIALRKLGCTRVEKRNGMIRYWYKPPVRNGATLVTNQPSALSSDDLPPSTSIGGHSRAPF